MCIFSLVENFYITFLRKLTRYKFFDFFWSTKPTINSIAHRSTKLQTTMYGRFDFSFSAKLHTPRFGSLTSPKFSPNGQFFAPRSSALIKPSSRWWWRAKTWGNLGRKVQGRREREREREIIIRFNNLFQARRSASRQRRRGAIGSRWAREKNRDGTATGRTTRGPRAARGSPAGQVRGKTCWINVTSLPRRCHAFPPPLAPSVTVYF